MADTFLEMAADSLVPILSGKHSTCRRKWETPTWRRTVKNKHENCFGQKTPKIFLKNRTQCESRVNELKLVWKLKKMLKLEQQKHWNQLTTVQKTLKSADNCTKNTEISWKAENFYAWKKERKFLVSGRDLACQQEVSLALTKTPPIHYYNVVDRAFNFYAGYLRI